MKVLFCALLLMLTSSKSNAQQYDYLVSMQPALTNSVVTIKGSKTPLLYYSCYNPSGLDAFVQLFDAVSASAVRLGTTMPKRVLTAPGLSDTGPQQPTPPLSFSLGMQVAATSTSNGPAAPSSPISCEFGYR